MSAQTVSALITWCASPTPHPADIERILNDLTDDDVEHVMLYHTGPAKRIAWLEYGRRNSLVKFEVGLSVTDKEVALAYEGQGPGIHGLTLFLEKNDD